MNEIINDVSDIYENGRPLANNLTQVRVIFATLFVKFTKIRDNSIILIILMLFF